MYCPRCGAENNIEEAKFCRACGGDLRVVVQALDAPSSLPMRWASQVDEWLYRRNERRTDNPGIEFAFGIGLMTGGVLGIWQAGQDWAVWFFLFLMGVMMTIVGGLSLWRYRRWQRGNYTPDPNRNPSDLSIFKPSLPAKPDTVKISITATPETARRTTAELPPLTVSSTPPPSITEETTRLLDDEAEPHRAR